MDGREQLVELHVREYIARQKHLDELLERAREHASNDPEFHDDLTVLAGKHDDMAAHVERFQRGDVDEEAVKAIEEAGPMGVWYGIMSELESLIERVAK